MRRRLWLVRAALHQGATGAVLAAIALSGLAVPRGELETGDDRGGRVLMAHDWKDRSLWFERGAQTSTSSLAIEKSARGRVSRKASKATIVWSTLDAG